MYMLTPTKTSKERLLTGVKFIDFGDELFLGNGGIEVCAERLNADFGACLLLHADVCG